MPTANDHLTTDFVIDAKADALLSDLSNEFADVVLQMAAHLTENRTASNVPLVDACDIADAAAILCDVVTEAAKKEGLTEERKSALCRLHDFCTAFINECEGETESE